MFLVKLSQSPWQHREYQRSLDLASRRPAAGVILIQDAVLALKAAPADYHELAAAAQGRGVKFYALAEDMAARGITAADAAGAGASVVDYGGFVDLIVKHGKVL